MIVARLMINTQIGLRLRLREPGHVLFEGAGVAPSDLCFPIALHGDEGSGLNEVPTLVLSWQPLFRRGEGGWKSRFVIGTFPARRMVKRLGVNETMEAFFQAVVAGSGS